MNKIFKSAADRFPVLKLVYYRLKDLLPLAIRRFSPVNWYNLRQLHPISKIYGLDRGHSTDRYYIDLFLHQYCSNIAGRVMEIGDDLYTQKFGTAVTHTDILDINSTNKFATLITDLRTASDVPNDYYDCIILTQVLQFIDEPFQVIRQIHRILKPGGVVLVTLPAISRIDVAAGVSGDYWRFTTASARYLFSKYFLSRNLRIKALGNVLSGTAFWQGIAWEELTAAELSYRDPDFPVIITVWAKK